MGRGKAIVWFIIGGLVLALSLGLALSRMSVDGHGTDRYESSCGSFVARQTPEDEPGQHYVSKADQCEKRYSTRGWYVVATAALASGLLILAAWLLNHPAPPPAGSTYLGFADRFADPS